jgi:hypothetical protein
MAITRRQHRLGALPGAALLVLCWRTATLGAAEAVVDEKAVPTTMAPSLKM